MLNRRTSSFSTSGPTSSTTSPPTTSSRGVSDKPIDGDYGLHLQNGGCPSLHETGGQGRQVFCQGRLGHYNFFTSKHYARMFSVKDGFIAVEWA